MILDNQGKFYYTKVKNCWKTQAQLWSYIEKHENPPKISPKAKARKIKLSKKVNNGGL